MIASCKWSVCAQNVDDGMMFDAIRKVVTDKKSELWWRDEYIAHRSAIDDNDPDAGFVCSFQVGSLDDLMTAVHLLRSARAAGVYVVASCDTSAIGSTATIGSLAGDMVAEMHQKPMEHDKARQLITEIEHKLDKLRTHVMTIDGQ